MRKLFFFSLFILIAQLCAAKNLEIGKTAPAFDAKLLDGAKFALSKNIDKVVVVHFWASWCVPCRQEMPLLDAYYKKHRAENLEVLAVSIDTPEDLAKVNDVMRAYSFPAAMLSEANFKEYGRIWRIPLTFVIDRQGILRKDGWTGDPTINLPLLEKTVTPLLTTP